ncbi:MAG: hypothetical protein E7557_01615 [Ruminococcaceae bacterium]|nr:hypothetical protein [Oscillospiraceae bacterium]
MNIESVEKNKTEITDLKDDALKKFTELKNKIIITADAVFQECNTVIEKSEKEILLKADASYLAQSEFGEYKNQTATAIQENSEAIKLNAGNIETTSNDLENYKSQNNAELSVQATAIMAQVENMFAKKSEHDEFTEAISSQITQTADNITEIFSQRLEDTNVDISTLGGTVSELVYSLDAYIKRGELESGVYGIEIGRSDSNIKARFTNDKLSFFQGNIEVAFISGNNLYITRAEITDYLKIGDSNNGYFIFDVSDNGLEVKWSYGS